MSSPTRSENIRTSWHLTITSCLWKTIFPQVVRHYDNTIQWLRYKFSTGYKFVLVFAIVYKIYPVENYWISVENLYKTVENVRAYPQYCLIIIPWVVLTFRANSSMIFLSNSFYQLLWGSSSLHNLRNTSCLIPWV